MDVVTLYTTWPDEPSALACARALVEARLAACANILGAAHSIYRWDGAVEEARETAMLVKTTRAAAPAARAMILTMHAYDTPCVAAWPVLDAESHAPYLDWVRASVDSRKGGGA